MVITSYLVKLGHWFYVNTRFGKWYFNRSLQQITNSYPLGHSAPITIDCGTYHVRIVSYSKDNYGFIIWRDLSNKCLIIDPGYFQPFDDIINSEGFILDSVLLTHKHYDHCGGIESIINKYPNIKIIANRREKISQVNTLIDESVYAFTVCDEDYLGPLLITAYHTPGHTLGHTVFTIKIGATDSILSDLHLLVFTGDAIFMGSIGAMFECSTTINLASLSCLIKCLLELNIPTNKIMLFPGHEYSIDCLHFLLFNCCPRSIYARSKLNWCYDQRNWMLPTIPMTLFDELNYSPYLRIAIATKSSEALISLPYLTSNNKLKQHFLPKLENLAHEILLSEKFIKRHVKTPYSDINEDKFRKELFEELFNDDDKILLPCEHCSMNYTPSDSQETNL